MTLFRMNDIVDNNYMAKKKRNVGVVVSYIAMTILALAITGISISVWAKPYASAKDSTEMLVISGEATKVFAESKLVDTIAINTAFLKKMREKGELLSSDEFASRITSYYDTLVAVLTALFVLFTLVTYMTFKSRFEIKFEEKARDLENNQRKKIMEELRSMLSDSKKLDEVIKSAVGGRIDDAIATQEEVDGLSAVVELSGKNILEISSSLEDIRKKQCELFKVVSDLQEQVANSASVYPTEEEEGRAIGEVDAQKKPIVSDDAAATC